MGKLHVFVFGVLLGLSSVAVNAGGMGLGGRMISHPTAHTDSKQATKKAAEKALVGTASFYAKHFHGRYTASGQRYDKDGFTAAHLSLPFGTKLKVTNLRNKRSVVVTVNDRGAFGKHGRIIDLSRAAAGELGMVRRGIAKVKLEVLQ